MTPEAFIPRDGWSDVREVVERFYAALREGDAPALAELAADRFADDVVLHRPARLRDGGSHAGIEAVQRVLPALIAPDAPVDYSKASIDHVVEFPEQPDELDQIVVAISFPWRSPAGATVRIGALDWWTFRSLRVAEIRALYWDAGAVMAHCGG